MSKINYKSDFDFTLRIYECTVGPDGQKTRVEMGFPTYDFEIRLYTTNRANAYICSKKGNKLQNCFNDEGKIHVVCDNHHLGKGVLHAEFTAFLPNNIYPDGSRKTVEVSHTVIELVDGSGDSPSIDDLKLTPAFVSDQGEALRVEAENKRVEAEAERKVAEATRTDSEAQRVEAEAKRNADEAKRIEAENKRKTTEAQIAESEALRDNTEAQRCEAEAQRVAAENLRKTDEEARKTAETQRVTAENERKAAEAQRAKDFEAIKQEVAVEDRIGIFPFNSIVEAHGSVSDDAPDYATQFPSTADGAYRHIIFDKSRGTFLWEIHAGDYPNCPAGDAYSAWKGSEEYLSEGHPRTDRLYRMGNDLYRWDGTALRSYSDDIAAQQDALDALRTRVSTNEGNIYTNADDIATLQDDLYSVASALNEDIGRLKENVSQITQIVDDGREVQNTQAETIKTLQGGLGEAQNEIGELSQLLVDYEDDAALALSNAEMRLGKRIDGVGILPFNTIVESHFSVIDGTPSYESQFPSAADGAYRHIIFDKSRGTFLWEIHAGDYPNCPAGDAYTSWKGSEEYVSEGHPRTDRLYRMGNDLYRWDGTALVSYSDTISAAIDTKADRTELSNIVGTPSDGVIEDLEPTLVTEALRKTAQTLTPAEQAQVKKNIGVSKMELFIDMWNARATIRGRSYGGYDPENAPDPSTPFKLNDIWLSYADAINVMNEPAVQPMKGAGFYTYGVSRTYFPILVTSYTIEDVGRYNSNLEVVRFLSHDMAYSNAGPDTALIPINNTTGAFMQCFKLREVKGILKLSASDYQGKHFHDGLWMCENLETIWLHSLSLNLSIASSPKIKAECFRYMVENAANTKAITITVHKDVFAKLTDESNTEWHQVLTDATNKNITFATL